MTAYYNEIDPYAAQWLRNLISKNLIAHGDVDERSIVDVCPADVAGYTQCHFFAGIGGWSLALRLAGWPDDRPVWTGSCPCQPFSGAGKGKGTADERHLWPAWDHLVRGVHPRVIFGEQVEAAIGHGWLDLVQDDLEGKGYTFGAVVVPAAGVGAPHGRHRIWWVAVAHHHHQGRLEFGSTELLDRERQALGHDAHGCGEVGGVANNNNTGSQGWIIGRDGAGERATRESRVARESFWSDATRIPCRDGKARPIKPGIQPLAHGIPARVGKLRAAGNAIVPQVAAEVIRAYMDCAP